VSITISYRGIILTAKEEQNLRMAVLVGNRWQLLSGTVDTVNKTVTVIVNHFSVYRLLVYMPATSNLKTVIVYPNQYKPGEAVNGTVKFQGLMANSTIRIYNVIGELIRTIEVTASNGTAEWNGRNEEGRPVGSGIYIYVVTCDSEKATGKIAIVR
jgi:flagellar hook assembly protein FlgD